MSDRLPSCPSPPDWSVSWDDLDACYPWIQAMRGCTQDAVNHGEGDVWVHVRMVCEAVAGLEAWRALSEEDRRVLFAAALLHDVAKPACRREEGGAITFPHHSRHGAIAARAILWRMGVPFGPREQVCGLIRRHLVPFHLLEKRDPLRAAIETSYSARGDQLSLLAEADARGRICSDRQRLLDNIALFVEYARENGCLEGPRVFPSDHARFLYFHDEGRSPDVAPYEGACPEVVLMSGLPGAGKDHWVRTQRPEWPVISLDATRAELDVSPADEQGPVLSRARELAREHLRRERSFVWNATNLSRQVRGECIRLCAGYGARIRIVYVEVGPKTLERQNRRRAVPVPGRVIERLLDRWELPDLTEAHAVEWHARTD